MKKSKAKITCLSNGCPERYSVCCHARSRAATEPERMLGVPEFFCSNCGKEFKGRPCSMGENLPKNFGKMKERFRPCPKCKKNTYIVSIFGAVCGSCFYEPKCKICYDKGFSTRMIGGTQGYTDFGALEKIKLSGVEIIKVYCTCEKGKRLKRNANKKLHNNGSSKPKYRGNPKRSR